MLSINKSSANTLKQIKEALKDLKPIEAYLQQRQQMKEAFDALNTKKDQIETEYKTTMKKAGEIEAKQLLGQNSSEGDPALEMNFSSLRDQQDRLRSTEEVLLTQQQDLDNQFDQIDTILRKCLGKISSIVKEELDAELAQIGQHASHILNRLHVLSRVVDLIDSSYADRVRKLEIPSLQNGKNFVIRPFRLHPLENTLMNETWKDDPAAVDLDRALKPFSLMKQNLRSIKRALDAERSKHITESSEFVVR